MGKRFITAVAACLFALTACGADDSSEDAGSDDPASTGAPADSDSPTDTEAPAESQPPADTDAPAESQPPADTDVPAETEPDEAESDDGDASPAGTGSGSATLELANGDSYEFSVLCALEPQEAAGSQILFTVVSYDNPSLDVTQFGSEGTVTDLATVSVYDAENFDSLWEASTIFEAFGGTLTLALDGSTVTAEGSFYPAADPAAEAVEGQLVANC